MTWCGKIYESALRILIYLVVNLNRNNAHFANFAFFWQPILLANCSLLLGHFAQTFASIFGQGLASLYYSSYVTVKQHRVIATDHGQMLTMKVIRTIKSVKQHPHSEWRKPLVKMLPSKESYSRRQVNSWPSCFKEREHLSGEWIPPSIHAVDYYKWEVNDCLKCLVGILRKSKISASLL